MKGVELLHEGNPLHLGERGIISVEMKREGSLFILLGEGKNKRNNNKNNIFN
jgi:hypothetical protein